MDAFFECDMRHSGIQEYDEFAGAAGVELQQQEQEHQEQARCVLTQNMPRMS